jgi:hypothetical protein
MSIFRKRNYVIRIKNKKEFILLNKEKIPGKLVGPFFIEVLDNKKTFMLPIDEESYNQFQNGDKIILDDRDIFPSKNFRENDYSPFPPIDVGLFRNIGLSLVLFILLLAISNYGIPYVEHEAAKELFHENHATLIETQATFKVMNRYFDHPFIPGLFFFDISYNEKNYTIPVSEFTYYQYQNGENITLSNKVIYSHDRLLSSYSKEGIPLYLDMIFAR